MATSQFVSLLILIASKEVLTWTIDLPEVRKYFFEKYSDDKNKLVEKNERYFDNIHADSPLNTGNTRDLDPNLDYYNGNLHYGGKEYENDIYHQGKYAAGFEYHSYMEKKVMDIVHNGSAYLEGLSRAIQNYTQVLQNCTRYNRTDENQTSENTTWLPQNETPIRSNGTLEQDERCERATRASEHVRRLAELALWAARELQDRDYAQLYQKPTSDEQKEENELLLRLAWFLDRLAHLTGFEPQVDAPPTLATRTATPPPTPFTVLAVPEDVKNSLMDCLSRDSSEPAYERCRYPLPLPDGVRRLFNISDTPLASSKTTTIGPIALPSSTSFMQPPTSPGPELLVPSENRHLSNFPPNLTPVKSVKKRSIDGNPLLNVIKYYVKHKLWTNSNARLGNSEEFDVDNDLSDVKSIQRRSIDNKKSKIHLPENPMQDLSNYIKHKTGINYLKDKTQAEKVRLYLDKIRHSDSLTAKNNVRKLEKTLKRVQKRSVHYEKKFLPRVAENPQKDISYYIKNKPGTNYDDNLVQAAQVRAGLEQIFQTGNIEVIRRYGSNFNPAVPNPLMAGILRSSADV